MIMQSCNCFVRLTPLLQALPKTRRAVRAVIQLLEDAFVVAQRFVNGNYSVEGLSPPQRLMVSEPDTFLPLREMSRSRQMMSKMSLQFAQTREGFFSLQVYRFIHFNTKSFIDNPPANVSFSSMEEYAEYINGVVAEHSEEEEAYICNRHAFGNLIAKRTWDRYPDYWAVSRMEKAVWPPSRDFGTAFDQLHALKKHAKTVKTGPDTTVWDGVGDLCIFQLLLDMHAVGLVEAPSAEEIGQIVGELRAGGKSGLTAAGYCSKSSSGREVKAAFVEFYKDVLAALTPEQADRLKWTTVVAEHTLCKLSRMLNKRHYVF